MNWNSFKYRNHDPAIGRFFNIDPLANKYVHNSPYSFSENQVVAHVELEGLEKVSIQQSLNNNYKFYNTYNIQRQTSLGIKFQQKLEGQSKYNILYYTFPTGGPNTAETTPVSSMEKFRTWKQQSYFPSLNEKEVELAMGDKELLLIGIDEALLDKNDSQWDAATSLNHEEVGHGIDLLDGNKNDVYGDHELYFGRYSYFSPDDKDVMTKPEYSNTIARKQFLQILQIIDAQSARKVKSDKNESKNNTN